MKILNELSIKARISAIELGNKLNVHYKTIIQRIKELKKSKIIIAFETFIDDSLLGVHRNLIAIDLNKMNYEENKLFIELIHKKKECIGMLKMIGKWNYEIGIKTKSNEKTWELYREIQTFLGEKIKSIELIPIFQKRIYNHFPQSILSK